MTCRRENWGERLLLIAKTTVATRRRERKNLRTMQLELVRQGQDYQRGRHRRDDDDDDDSDRADDDGRRDA